MQPILLVRNLIVYTNLKKTIMKRFLFITFISCFSLFSVNAQTTGSFQTSITFFSQQHTLAFYVPTTYNSVKSYPLVVALHGCGGNAVSFRNSLLSISDSLDAIILCPDFIGNQIIGANGQIIPNAIDTTINVLGYNIDINAVYLTGFSCNGQETFKQGWDEVYSFRGIIPFNAWIPMITDDYNFDSKIPTCICSGTADGSYTKNVTLYDSLIFHNGFGKFNSLPGIGHVWNYAGRVGELMECFNWIDSIYNANVQVDNPENYNFDMNIYPNPADNYLKINLENIKDNEVEVLVSNINGKLIYRENQISNTVIKVNTSDFSSGMYFIQLQTKSEIIGQKKFVIHR